MRKPTPSDLHGQQAEYLQAAKPVSKTDSAHGKIAD